MKKKINQLEKDGYHLIPESVGIILDSIWVKDDEIIIKSAFGGQWIFRPLKDDEKSL